MSLNLDIDSLPPEKVEAAITRLEAMKAQRAAENKLAHYRPYPKQAAFHEAGARCRERLLIAANQSGKSLAGAMECAMHATGRYPDWWKGRRFDKPTIGWGAGATNETTRDTVQRILVGRPGQPGTAAIPKDAIIDLISARGTPDLLDSIKVMHVSGGVSVIGLKSYQRGRESFKARRWTTYGSTKSRPPTSLPKV
jgi:phage terminase large subunit-like protein